jgi:hypothetical protein
MQQKTRSSVAEPRLHRMRFFRKWRIIQPLTTNRLRSKINIWKVKAVDVSCISLSKAHSCNAVFCDRSNNARFLASALRSRRFSLNALLKPECNVRRLGGSLSRMRPGSEQATTKTSESPNVGAQLHSGHIDKPPTGFTLFARCCPGHLEQARRKDRGGSWVTLGQMASSDHITSNVCAKCTTSSTKKT